LYSHKGITATRVMALTFSLHFHVHQDVLNLSLFKPSKEIFILYTYSVRKLLSLLLIHICGTNIFKLQF
jgi:hypothetical protein